MKMCKSLFVAMAVAVAAWAQDEMGPVESPAVEMPMMSAPQNPNPALAAEPVAPAKKTRVKKVRPPHEHRGFFFSMGMGVSYVTTSVDESNVSYSTGSGYLDTDGNFIPQSKYERERILHEEFSGWATPIIEFRFGKSIGNLVALYSIFSTGIYQGEGSHKKMNRELSYRYDRSGTLASIDTIPNGTKKKKDGALAFFESFGLGLSVYPFRNPESILNGLYIGASGGFEGFDSHLDDSFSLISNGGVYMRFELGKDWWVSDTWSLGVGIAYVNVTVFEDGNDKEEHERNSISFFIRLTHG